VVDLLAEEGKLEETAIAFAPDAAAKGAPWPKVRDRAVSGGLDEIEAIKAKHKRKFKGFKAPGHIVQALEAAVNLPFEDGLRREQELFGELLISRESAAQRHVFFAQRLTAKVPDIGKEVPILPIRKVGVIGAGTMGGGIAMNFLSAGIPVTILEMQQEALDRGVGVIRRNYENTAKRGRMTVEQVEAAMSNLSTTLEYNDLADCDLVIEAVYENMDVKKEVFGKLDTVVKQGAILASNTSYLDVNEIAAATKRPGYVLGLHFFSPANVMKLLEIVRGAETRHDVLATAMKLSKKIGKVAVVAGVCHGFIGNRMLSPRQEQANALIMEGANYWEVDEVLLDFGFPMGPFQMADLAGIDIGWHRDPSKVTTLREALCAAGRFGQKNGKGFYDYDESRNRTPSDEVRALIAEFAAKSGTPQREISREEIKERLLYPMVNEGAMILDEGMAQRASDIDVVWINGYGWPLYTGGPMFWADTVGLTNVVAGLEKYGLPVCDYLRGKAERGERFNG